MVSIVAQEAEFTSSKLAKELKVALEKLPLDAQESIVDNNFIARVFLLELGAIALPIFFNGEKITEAAKVNAKNAINEIINKARKQHNFDLISYFYPNFIHSKNTSIFELPNLAFIASSCFENIPAVYKSKVAYDYYSQLAKEYFLQ